MEVTIAVLGDGAAALDTDGAAGFRIGSMSHLDKQDLFFGIN